MVKGTTRQVIVVKSPDPKLFDQAIFLVRDDVLAHGGVTEEALMNEVKQICNEQKLPNVLLSKLFWSCCGASIVGLFWGISLLF